MGVSIKVEGKWLKGLGYQIMVLGLQGLEYVGLSVGLAVTD